MGDANTVLTESEAWHLLRRTGFGATRKDAAKLAGKRTRGQAADKLLAFKPKPIKLTDRDSGFDDAQERWLLQMIKAKSPLQERLVLFWHDHFATANSVVENTEWMAEQNNLIRMQCKGNFRAFVKAMNKNRAMMDFLDTVRNSKAKPNENYARELQELFTLGVKDAAGNDTYTQDDIVQIARAFTGWRFNDDEGVFLREDRHDFTVDFPDRGPKVIYTTTGGFGPGGVNFGAVGEGPLEIDAVVDVILEHRDTDGMKTVARRTASRLLEYFAHATPSLAAVDAVVAASGFDTNWEIAGLLRAIFCHDEFYQTSAPQPFSPTTPKSVRWPVDYVVTTIRLLGIKTKIDRERGLRIEAGSRNTLRTHLERMGQEVMNPPSVFGWDWETAWISSATLLARYRFAIDCTAKPGDKEKPIIRADKLVSAKLTDPAAIVDAATDLLGVTDQLSPAERMVLIDYLTDHGANPVIDGKNVDVRYRKIHGLLGLVLQSPAYQLQ